MTIYTAKYSIAATAAISTLIITITNLCPRPAALLGYEGAKGFLAVAVAIVGAAFIDGVGDEHPHTGAFRDLCLAQIY